MADNVTIPTTGAGDATPKVATDQLAGGEHVQIVKIMDATADGSNRLIVSAAGAAKVDGSAVTQPVSIAASVVVTDSQVVTDNAAFTDGTTKVFMGGFIFDEVAGTALTENDAAAARIDSKRSLVGVIEDATTRGQRAAVSAGGALKVDGSAVTQPVSVAAALPVTDNAGSLTVDAPVGTPVFVRLSDGTSAVTVTAGRLVVDGSGVTQPVSVAAVVHVDDNAGSLTVDAPVGTPVFVRLSDGAATLVGQKVMASSLPVTISSDQSALAVSQSGTWTVQPGNTANTTPWLSSLRPGTSGGLTTATGSIGATKTQLKGSAGQVFGWYIYNPNASVVYVQVFDVLSASVTLGTTAPTYSIGIPPSSGANVFSDIGILHAAAITIAITTTRAGLTAPGATVDYNVFYA